MQLSISLWNWQKVPRSHTIIFCYSVLFFDPLVEDPTTYCTKNSYHSCLIFYRYVWILFIPLRKTDFFKPSKAKHSVKFFKNKNDKNHQWFSFSWDIEISNETMNFSFELSSTTVCQDNFEWNFKTFKWDHHRVREHVSEVLQNMTLLKFLIEKWKPQHADFDSFQFYF